MIRATRVRAEHPNAITAAQPGARSLSSSGASRGSCARVCVLRPPLDQLTRHAPRIPPSRESNSADAGTIWR
jgi:hypothetical protein